MDKQLATTTEARATLGNAQFAEIAEVFPGLLENHALPACPIATVSEGAVLAFQAADGRAKDSGVLFHGDDGRVS